MQTNSTAPVKAERHEEAWHAAGLQVTGRPGTESVRGKDGD